MGEDYWFAISIVNISSELKLKYNEMGDEKFTSFMEKEYFPLFKQAYENLLKIYNWFPVFGEIESSGSKGYGCGSQTEKDGEFEKSILQFTKQFPEFTFGIYLFYYDLVNVIYWTIQNDTITNKIDKRTSPITTDIELKIYIRYSMNNVCINNNILDAFNTKYSEYYSLNLLSFE